jgi:hypothetical protein
VRRLASPPRGPGQDTFGRARYYFDTERRTFYTLPSREHPRSRRLDLAALMGHPATNKDFRVRKDGEVYFRGVKVGHKVTAKATPRRLRSAVRVPMPGPPKDTEYYARILLTNPGYQLLSLNEHNGAKTGVYRHPRSGHVFTVTT